MLGSFGVIEDLGNKKFARSLPTAQPIKTKEIQINNNIT